MGRLDSVSEIGRLTRTMDDGGVLSQLLARRCTGPHHCWWKPPPSNVPGGGKGPYNLCVRIVAGDMGKGLRIRWGDGDAVLMTDRCSGWSATFPEGCRRYLSVGGGTVGWKR